MFGFSKHEFFHRVITKNKDIKKFIYFLAKIVFLPSEEACIMLAIREQQ